MAGRAHVAVLGGTFDHFHAGHRDLLDAAFDAADRVGIGVTTDSFLRSHPKPIRGRLEPFQRRRAGVARYLESRFPTGRWWIVPLDDPWGRSVEPGVDLLVVSAETSRAGRAVNRERRRRGLPSLRIISVPLHLGEDLIALSSRAIRAGLVDPAGRRRRPLRIVLPVGPREELDQLRAAIRHEFAPLAVQTVPRSRLRSKGSATRLPPWDFAIERTNMGGRRGGLKVTDRSGASATVPLRGASSSAVAAGVGRFLAGRRKAFHVARGSAAGWRRTSGSRSTARGRDPRRSPTG